MTLATYVVNQTRLTVDMRDPLAEAQRLIDADPLTRGVKLTPIPGFGSYSRNAASGSIDTGSGHVDFNAEKMTDAQARRCVTYLRRVGFLAYFRPRSWYSWWKKAIRKPGWQRHLHCVLVGSADLSTAAVRQIAEWKAGGDGLVGPEKDADDRTVVGRTWAAYKALVAAVKAAGANVGNAARVKALQKALRLPVDGKWGPVTDAAVWRLREARRRGTGLFNSYDLPTRRELQRQWGAKPVDGLYGKVTAAAVVTTVKAAQAALGVTADGQWGPVTDQAYRKLRAATFLAAPKR